MADLEKFRAETRAWLEQNCPAEMRQPMTSDGDTFWGGRNAKFSSDAQRVWFERMRDKGWTVPHWPKQYGGGGLDGEEAKIVRQEMAAIGARQPLTSFGISMLGPALLQYGTEEQKKEHLPKITAGLIRWCQGYSEPGAGSDLANLRTSAVINGDEFVINGQKIWTTMAHDATHIFMLVRTDPKAPKKQQGISFILVPMDQPGIEVRTITTLAGETEFCEVFFDDARTPFENLVGELNKGWTMAKSLLSFERVFIGAPNLAQNALGQLEVFARSYGRFDDPVFCDRFAEVALDVEDHAALYARFADQLKRGETLGADVSMLKIWVTETFQKITELMIEAAGSDGATLGPLQVGNVGVDVLASFYKARPATIYGGSNEIQRNILSKAVLGLPG